jgi:hypothetical protein
VGVRQVVTGTRETELDRFLSDPDRELIVDRRPVLTWRIDQDGPPQPIVLELPATATAPVLVIVGLAHAG